jgi:hypothetical protein
VAAINRWVQVDGCVFETKTLSPKPFDSRGFFHCIKVRNFEGCFTPAKEKNHEQHLQEQHLLPAASLSFTPVLNHNNVRLERRNRKDLTR